MPKVLLTFFMLVPPLLHLKTQVIFFLFFLKLDLSPLHGPGSHKHGDNKKLTWAINNL